MEHFERTEHVSSPNVRRLHSRPKTRWIAVLGAAAFAAMLLPLGGSTPGHAASDPPEGLLCKTNAGGTAANPTSSFQLTAKAGYILTPDNNSIYMWSYSAGNDPFQFPGATLCVTQGDQVTITLKNKLNVPTSIMLPGMTGVLADGSSQCLKPVPTASPSKRLLSPARSRIRSRPIMPAPICTRVVRTASCKVRWASSAR